MHICNILGSRLLRVRFVSFVQSSSHVKRFIHIDFKRVGPHLPFNCTLKVILAGIYQCNLTSYNFCIGSESTTARVNVKERLIDYIQFSAKYVSNSGVACSISGAK